MGERGGEAYPGGSVPGACPPARPRGAQPVAQAPALP